MRQDRKRPLTEILSKQYPEYTRDQLLAYIVCRNVLVDGEISVDPRTLVRPDAVLTFTFSKYVSRGAYKLEHALNVWHIDPTGLVMLDAGSSTGGFTDCLLQKGAQAVHAVDVGYNQLDYRLRCDKRVLVHEKQNIMALDTLDPQPDAAVADLSFRSIRGAASHILGLTRQKWLVSLIKPQFEVPRWKEGFFGVVDNAALLHQVLLEVFVALEEEGVGCDAIVTSPILGRKGNTEFLALLKPDVGMSQMVFERELQKLVPIS